MLLKYNISNIKYERRFIDIDTDKTKTTVSEDGLTYIVSFTTHTQHKLHAGDTILLERPLTTAATYTDAERILRTKPKELINVINNEIREEKNIKQEIVEVEYQKGVYGVINGKVKRLTDNEFAYYSRNYSTTDIVLTVNENGLTETNFQLTFPKYQQIYFESATLNNDGWSYTVTLKQPFPFAVHKDDSFDLRMVEYTYDIVRNVNNITEPIFDVQVKPSNMYLGHTYVRYGYANDVYEWKRVVYEIPCVIIDKSHFYLNDDAGYWFDDFYGYYEIENTTIITSNNLLSSDFKLYEYNESIDINLPITSKNIGGLLDDDIIQQYLEEKQNSLIPGVTDYEKCCFSPYVENNGIYEAVSKIKFNVFLRDRQGSDEWNTNDLKGWVQMPSKISDSAHGTTLIYPKPTLITEGDLLGTLNFTDDDIYYRKKKVSKTFLRLSFYDSNNPYKQMLLFYSTIFLDTNELYGKYIKSKNLKYLNDNLVHDPTLGENNLTLSFNVCDRFERNKSSEGFYLYLFPENIKEIDNRQIYMKVEFNHAGNGKTIPLIYPHKDGKPLTFKDDTFPTKLTNREGDLKEFYRQLFIPVTIKYDNKTNTYQYSFDVVQANDSELTINLFEPKIN